MREFIEEISRILELPTTYLLLKDDVYTLESFIYYIYTIIYMMWKANP